VWERLSYVFTLLRWESPRGKCVKLHTAAASNNRDQAPRSLYYCLYYIWVLFFAHIPFLVNHTFNATPTERLQHHSTTTLCRPIHQLCQRSTNSLRRGPCKRYSIDHRRRVWNFYGCAKSM